MLENENKTKQKKVQQTFGRKKTGTKRPKGT
jgi:hypothetical protein